MKNISKLKVTTEVSVKSTIIPENLALLGALDSETVRSGFNYYL